MSPRSLGQRLSHRAIVLALLSALGYGPRPAAGPAPVAEAVSGEWRAVRDNSDPRLIALRARPAPRPPKPQPRPRPRPRPRPQPSRTKLLLAIARQYIGVRYVWGGTTPAGFDCSGYTRFTYRKVGVYLPRTSRDQAQVGQAVSGLSEARIGDLLFFSWPVHHVAIYIGPGLMLHAPHAGTTVRIEAIYEAPSHIRRVIP